MRRLRSWSLLLLLFGAGGAFAQVLTVAYVEGDARVRNGAAWVELSIGDSVSGESTVQLGDGAYLELTSASARIALSQKGSYSLHNILSSSRALGSTGAGKALLASLSHLASEPARNQGAVGGARGANESKTDDTEWEGSSAQVFLDSGREFSRSGQYDQAIAQLTQALAVADETEVPEVRFNLADAYSLKGDTRGALKLAASLKPSGGEAWAADFVLLKAKLLMDTNAFSQEITWLTQNGNDLSGDAQRGQVYLFLLGVAYRGAGDTANQKEALTKAVFLSPDSDLGKAAAQLLQTP